MTARKTQPDDTADDTGDDTEGQTVAAPPRADAIGELLGALHLHPSAHVLDTVWEWAGRHFGLERPT